MICGTEIFIEGLIRLHTKLHQRRGVTGSCHPRSSLAMVA